MDKKNIFKKVYFEKIYFEKLHATGVNYFSKQTFTFI